MIVPIILLLLMSVVAVLGQPSTGPDIPSLTGAVADAFTTLGNELESLLFNVAIGIAAAGGTLLGLCCLFRMLPPQRKAKKEKSHHSEETNRSLFEEEEDV